MIDGYVDLFCLRDANAPALISFLPGCYITQIPQVYLRIMSVLGKQLL
jgi:hypothetical protein